MPPANKSTTGDGLQGRTAIVLALLAVAAGVAYKARDLLPSGLVDILRPRPLDVTPHPAPRMLDLPELTDKKYQDDMLWGSYRPALYFGMRTRSSKSLLHGLMWFDPDNHDTLNKRKVRHHASLDDKLSTYGWQRHDGRSFGRQLLVDEDYNITLLMAKHRSEDSGIGGDWAVRVEARRANPARGGPRKRISWVMYLGDEAVPSSPWKVMPEGDVTDLQDGVTLLTGGNSVVGPWSFHSKEFYAAPTPGTLPDYEAKRFPSAARVDYLALPTEGQYDYLLHVKELMLGIMYEQLERNPPSDVFQLFLPNGATTGSNLALFQVTLTVPSAVDFVFLSHKKGVEPSQIDTSERVAALTGDALTGLLREREEAFDRRFERRFVARKPPGSLRRSNKQSDSASAQADAHPSPGGGGSGNGSPAKQEAEGEGAAGKADRATLEVAKVALSNLLGSMGYWHGNSQVRLPEQSSAVHSYWPVAMFSAVPSRSLFPHGHLWHEGFHQLLVQRWNPQLSRDVLAHWLDTLNANGWIPREQILSEEARSHVPEDTLVQDVRDAAPPTLLLPIMEMARKLQRATPGAGADAGQVSTELQPTQQFLQAAWPRLAAWHHWLNTTQQGVLPHTYRWRGRNATTVLELNPRTSASGLDDYPRASHPSADERHLDLWCWMAMASEAMVLVGDALGLPEEQTAPYQTTWDALRDLKALQQAHQDPGTGHFLDFGLHSEDAALHRRSYPVEGQVQDITFRVVTSQPAARLVPCFGYVSLMPLLMKLLSPESDELGRQLTLMTDTQLLWTDYGLRAVSPQCSLFHKYNTQNDPPNWRGQVWINFNYLALVALEHYSTTEGPWAGQARAAHAALQQAVTSNVVSEYWQRGYLWEQYDDGTGRGLGSHPFTGWSALVALMG